MKTSEDFELRLASYSTLGSAALVAASIAAVSPEASAQIHNLTLSDFNGGTVPSLTVSPGFNGHVTFTLGPIVHHLLRGTENPFGSAFGLDIAGFPVARDLAHTGLASNVTGVLAGNLFEAGTAVVYGVHVGASGNFRPGGPGHVYTGLVGFEVPHSGGPYYGWVRVKVDYTSGLRITFAPDGNGIYGAYGVAGTGITAGEFTPIPEPTTVAGGLALLALGAAGVRELRRRRAVA